MTELHVEKRDTSRKSNTLREEGYLPAVIYGRIEESTSISIPTKDFQKIWREAGESSIVTLKGLEEDKDVLIYDVQVDPLYDFPLHADLYVTEKGRKLQTSVPLEFTGTSPAVKDFNGILVKVLHEVTVESIPSKLPQSIEVDISGLDDFEKNIQVKDLTTPEGVEIIEDPEEVIVLVSEGQEEPEEEEQEQPDISQVEVEKKGKQEEESGEESAN